MTLNLTINEASPASPSAVAADLQVRAFFNETDAGQVFGPFRSVQAAESCATVLAGRAGVVRVTIEPAA